MDQSLKTVYFYGRLRDLIGQDSLQLSGESAYELIDGVSTAFKEVLQPTPERERIVVKVKDFETEEDIRRPLKEDETEIHLYPTLLGGGGKNGGLFKIIVGVIMVAVVAWAIVATGGMAALMDICSHLQVLHDGHPREDPASFRHLDQPLKSEQMGRGFRDVLVQKVDSACLYGDQSGQGMEY